MLSILIPVHNVDVRHLVLDLLQQCRQLGIVFEILLEEDGSQQSFVTLNKELEAEEEVSLIVNPIALGRSKARNKLAELARFQNLLFMDCDAQVKHPDYISQYWQCLRNHEDSTAPFVVLGGLSYREECPDKNHRLRWKYGIRREVRSAAQRNLNPYAFFTPFNMLLSKSVFDFCRFNESLITYGFEDTLFGEKLQMYGIKVAHVDNELYHDGIDENLVFLEKVEQSVDNLVKLYHEHKLPCSFVNNSKLLTTYFRCKKFHSLGCIVALLNASEKMLRKKVLQHSSLVALDALKLKWLCEKL